MKTLGCCARGGFPLSIRKKGLCTFVITVALLLLGNNVQADTVELLIDVEIITAWKDNYLI